MTRILQLSPLSPQIHALLTAATAAADAGHIKDAGVLLYEALDHDFMVDVAQALHELQNEPEEATPFDLRPLLANLLRIPPPAEGVHDSPPAAIDAPADVVSDEGEYDFFGLDLIVDTEELTPSHEGGSSIEQPAHGAAGELEDDSGLLLLDDDNLLTLDDDNLLTLDDDNLLTLDEPELMPLEEACPAVERGTAAERRPRSAEFTPVSNTFDDIDDLDSLFAGDFNSSPTDDQHNFSLDEVDALSDTWASPIDEHGAAGSSNGMMGDVSAGTSSPGARARYAASAPAPPPPSHRRSSTPTDDVSVHPDTSAADNPFSDLQVEPGAESQRSRATSEASPVVSVVDMVETGDDLDDFDLFGDSPAPDSFQNGASASTPTSEPAPMPTLSGMTSRVQDDTNPAGLPTVDSENHERATEFDTPGVSGVNSTVARARSGTERSDLFSGAQPQDTGSRLSIHGAGTYRASGMSEDTGIKRRARPRLTSTMVLKKRPLTRDQRKMLTSKSMFLYEQVDGVSTIEDLIDISGMAADEAMEVLEVLVYDHMVDVL